MVTDYINKSKDGWDKGRVKRAQKRAGKASSGHHLVKPMRWRSQLNKREPYERGGNCNLGAMPAAEKMRARPRSTMSDKRSM